MVKKAAGRSPKQSSRRATTPKKLTVGPRRVASWVYGVFNPMIDALEHEEGLLKARNPTWSHRGERLQIIRAPDKYLLNPGQLVYRDWAQTRPSDVRPLEHHAKLTEEIQRTAKDIYLRTLGKTDLLKAVVDFVEEFKATPAGELYKHFDTTRSHELAADLVDLMINHVERLEPGQRDAQFWDQYGTRLRGLLMSDQFAKDQFHHFDELLSTAYSDGGSVIRHLTDLRAKLCSQFDIPFAPIGVGSAFD